MIKKVLSATLILALLVAIIAALCWRAMLSVETTDEVYGISSILSIVQGAKPFYTSWSPQTSWCLAAPFFSAFLTWTNGNKDGIILFSRIIYIIFTIIVIGYITLKLTWKHKHIAYLAIFGCIAYVPFSMFQLGYNNLAAYFLFLVAYFIDEMWKDKSATLTWIVPGIFMGLACISYVTLPVMAVITALCIFALNKHSGMKKALWFSFGVLIVGGIFCAWILSEATLSQILIALDGMLHSPHEAGKGPFWLFAIKAFVVPFISLKRLIIAIFFTVGSVYFQCKIKRYPIIKNHKVGGEWYHFIVYITFSALNCLLLLYQPVNDLFACVFWLLTVTWIFFDPNLKLKKYAVYILIQIGFTITYALSSDNTNCLVGLAVTIMITSFIGINALIDIYANSRKQTIVALCAVLFFVTPGLLNVYRYVYRDEPIFKLNTKVESGIYKGLYTTSERRDFVLKIEDLISHNISSSDRLCVVTREPMFYIMSDAKIVTPTTWDPQWLGRKTKQGILTSDQPIHTYFRNLKIEYPNIIAATNTLRKDFFD